LDIDNDQRVTRPRWLFGESFHAVPLACTTSSPGVIVNRLDAIRKPISACEVVRCGIDTLVNLTTDQIRSTPMETESISENDFECLAKRKYVRDNVFPRSGSRGAPFGYNHNRFQFRCPIANHANTARSSPLLHRRPSIAEKQLGILRPPPHSSSAHTLLCDRFPTASEW
jgi:hypothetical protein